MHVAATARPIVTCQTPHADLPEMLTVEEFCAYTGLSDTTVYDMIRRNELPVWRRGRRILIYKTALQPS